jgi:hypothetical protein
MSMAVGLNQLSRVHYYINLGYPKFNQQCQTRNTNIRDTDSIYFEEQHINFNIS